MQNDIRCLHCDDAVDLASESLVTLTGVRYLEDGIYHESCAEGLGESVAEGVWIDSQIDAAREWC